MKCLCKIVIIYFIYIFITPLVIYPQNDSIKVDSAQIKLIQNMIVERIILIGNDKTKEEVILRELKTKEGNKLDLAILEADIKRLYNLGLFVKIDVLPAPLMNNKINLIFEFQESFYFLPIPQGGIKEGEIKKIWGGINFEWRNFRGMNHTINLSFGVGYEPFIFTSFTNPWVLGKHHYFYQFGVGFTRNYDRSLGKTDSSGVIFLKEEVPTYKIDNLQGVVRFGKYLNDYTALSAIFSYFSKLVSEYEESRTLSIDGHDQYPSLTFDFSYDSRDYNKFPLKGFYNNIQYTRIGFFNELYDLNKVRFDIRNYLPLNIVKNYSIIIAGRFNTALTFGGGEIPSYLREQLGYDNLIRGWNNFVFQGEDKLFASAELRIPIIQPFFVKGQNHVIVNKLPIVKEFSYRYGLYTTVFYDLGGVWGRKENITDTEFKSGYGLGLNFLLPFNFVARTDFGLRKENSKYKGQLIISLDASF
jgi:outer membrane protein assembly factor BamA